MSVFLQDGRAGSPVQRASCSRESCSPDLGQKAGYQATGPALSPCAPPRRTHTSMAKLLLFSARSDLIASRLGAALQCAPLGSGDSEQGGRGASGSPEPD